MHRGTLRPGLTVRPPRLDDDHDIFALVCAYNQAIVGMDDCTLVEIRDGLDEPGLVRETDAWLVHDGVELVGYATALLRAGSNQARVDVVAPRADVAGWLLDCAVERVRAMGHESGHRQVAIDHSIYREDTMLQRVLTGRGFIAATSFYRMRIDHAGSVDGPTMPTGIRLRSCTEAESVRRSTHHVRERSFTEHYGEVAESYEQWVAALEGRATFSWDHVRLAEDDGDPVGMIRVCDQFVEDDHCGYVAQLGVVPSARRRGIAKAMLRWAFAGDAARGLDGTLLHVDSNNTTPALRLYESVGMRPVLAIDTWRLVLTP